MEVTVGYHYLAGDLLVSEHESVIMGIQHFEVGGHLIPSDVAVLENQGPFLTLTLSMPLFEDDAPYLERARESIAALRAELTADEWLEGTTDDVLVLPVSSIKWAELVTA